MIDNLRETCESLHDSENKAYSGSKGAKRLTAQKRSKTTKDLKKANNQQPKKSIKIATKDCPHCQRTFNTLTADRHIPICEKTKHRPKPPPKKDVMLKTKEDRLKLLKRAQS